MEILKKFYLEDGSVRSVNEIAVVLFSNKLPFMNTSNHIGSLLKYQSFSKKICCIVYDS